MKATFKRLILIASCSIVMLVIVFGLHGCAGKSVLFNNGATGIDKDNSEDVVYRVFFDREGNIYPNTTGESSVEINTNDFNSGPGTGYLQRYFCENRGQLKNVASQAEVKQYYPYKCALDKRAKEGKIGAIEIEKWGDWIDQWTYIQEGLLNKQSRLIAKLLKRKENADRTLFILIHGYNNTFSSIEESYDEVRSALKKNAKYKDEKFVFLDIYWDGFDQTLPLNIWGSAQYTGPIVGVRMRKLLKEIEASRPIRILTHSSGAFVAGSLIGDSRKALTLWKDEGVCNKKHNNYDQMVCLFKDVMLSKGFNSATGASLSDYGLIKSKDLRVGMIAPATSSWTFIGDEGEQSLQTGGKGLLKPSGTLRLIVGQHEDDFANTKLVGLECYKGVTTLGVRKTSFCEIKEHIADEEYGLKDKVDVQRVDFKTEGKERYTKFIFRADHGLKAYLDRGKATEDFWSLLLDADAIPSEKVEREDNICPKNYQRSCEG